MVFCERVKYHTPPNKPIPPNPSNPGINTHANKGSQFTFPALLLKGTGVAVIVGVTLMAGVSAGVEGLIKVDVAVVAGIGTDTGGVGTVPGAGGSPRLSRP